MATDIVVGKEVRSIELLDLFPASEGMITQYYGRIGSGKTYAATSDILRLLRRGQVVYANWKLNYGGFDETRSMPHIFLGLIFPWRKRFFRFPKENLHYLPVDKDFHAKLAKITDAHIFLDEGHTAFDSYEMARMPLERRMSILHTRHFDRSIHIISQRPTAVHVVMRANVNIFYKCERLRDFLWIPRFRRTEYQDLIAETVDEAPEKAVSVRHYWGNQSIFEAYNSKYLRGQIEASQKVLFSAYDTSYVQRLALFWRYYFPKKAYTEPKNKRKLSTKLSTSPTKRQEPRGGVL